MLKPTPSTWSTPPLGTGAPYLDHFPQTIPQCLLTERHMLNAHLRRKMRPRKCSHLQAGGAEPTHTLSDSTMSCLAGTDDSRMAAQRIAPPITAERCGTRPTHLASQADHHDALPMANK